MWPNGAGLRRMIAPLICNFVKPSLYMVEDKKITVIIVAIGHRRDIYEKLKRLLNP